MQRALPNATIRVVPYPTRFSGVTRIVEFALLGLFAVVVLELVTGLPRRVLPSTLVSNAPFAFVFLMLARSAALAMSASGALEVVDVTSGNVLFSRLATGRMPRSVDAVLARFSAGPSTSTGGEKRA